MFKWQANGNCSIIKYEDPVKNNLWDRLKTAWDLVRGKYTSFAYLDGEEEIRETISVFDSILLTEEPEPEKVIHMKKAFPEAILPTRAHDSDVGWDLYSPIDFRLNPGEMRRIDFGIIIGLPKEYYIQVHNRSSVVWRYSTMMALGVGVVDPMYRGTIQAPFYNLGRDQVQFSRGDRLAQMVIRKVEDMVLVEGNVDIETERADGGFGSSGK